jgi:benzoate/toluate 1,2-dioxygenase reductase subunit
LRRGSHERKIVAGYAKSAHLIIGKSCATRVKKIPSFTFATCVADKGSNHPLKGYVTHHLEAKHLNAGDVDVYLCGPPPMVEAVRVFFRDQGVNPVNFHYEKFTPSEGGAS